MTSLGPYQTSKEYIRFSLPLESGLKSGRPINGETFRSRVGGKKRAVFFLQEVQLPPIETELLFPDAEIPDLSPSSSMESVYEKSSSSPESMSLSSSVATLSAVRPDCYFQDTPDTVVIPRVLVCMQSCTNEMSTPWVVCDVQVTQSMLRVKARPFRPLNLNRQKRKLEKTPKSRDETTQAENSIRSQSILQESVRQAPRAVSPSRYDAIKDFGFSFSMPALSSLSYESPRQNFFSFKAADTLSDIFSFCVPRIKCELVWPADARMGGRQSSVSKSSRQSATRPVSVGEEIQQCTSCPPDDVVSMGSLILPASHPFRLVVVCDHTPCMDADGERLRNKCPWEPFIKSAHDPWIVSKDGVKLGVRLLFAFNEARDCLEAKRFLSYKSINR
eukprot:Platyproteum_vivax@DN3918_c0_g1_i1.p1